MIDSDIINRELTIACCQTNSFNTDHEGDPRDANLELMDEWLSDAAEEDTDISVFGEAFLTGYDNGEETYKYAVHPNGEYIEAVEELAAEYGMSIIFGATTRSRAVEGGLYNSAYLIDSSGEKIGRYDKTHLGDVIYPDGIAHESVYWDKGNELQVFDLDGVSIGVHICYDIVYPETARALTVKGAEVIINPSAAVHGYESTWDRSIPCRALENQVFYVMTSSIGEQRDTRLIGGSRITAPSGDTLTSVSWDEPTLVTETIDLNTVNEVRSTSHVLRNRRPELYTSICEDPK